MRKPELGPNCLPRLSAGATGRQRVNNINNKQDTIQLIIMLIYPVLVYSPDQGAYSFLQGQGKSLENEFFPGQGKVREFQF